MTDDVERFSCARCSHLGLEKKRCDECGAIQSPFSDHPDAWLLLPDRWTGEHAMRYAKVVGSVPKGQGLILTNFAASLALLEDWNLPGLSGNPDKWNFAELDLAVIAWVNFFVVQNGFLKCFDVPLDF